MEQTDQPIAVVLIALYRNVNFAVRIMHSLLEDIDGIKPYSFFIKNSTKINNKLKFLTQKEEELFVKQIIELNPKLVGISVLSPFVPMARKLTKLIHDNTSALVIWGGIHPTIKPELCIKETDIICIGEGEEAITELAIHLRDGKDYSNIENLWINYNNNIVKNKMRPLLQDLDSLPYPSYNKDSFYFITNNKITRKDPALMESTYHILTARGCPYVCSYCVNGKLKQLYKGLGVYCRRRSVDNILPEMKEHLSLTNAHENVWFVDEVFANDESWLNKFESLYTKEIGLPIVVTYHPELIKPMILSKLIKCGLTVISFGIQTGSDYIRKHIFHRPGTNSEMINLARSIAKNYNVKIIYDLILDNPYDNEESLKDVINVFMQLPKPLYVEIYSMHFYPDYPLTLKAIKDGYITAETASVENLMERQSKDIFGPRWKPHNKEQMLQNIIWLYSRNYTSDKNVKYAVFGDSIGSKLVLNYLNYKAIVIGEMTKIVSQNLWISRIVNGIKYILKGEMTILFSKIQRSIHYKLQERY
jgi:anaerobic magnesium-protoporphyrin IX monomethyl ester cyclase